VIGVPTVYFKTELTYEIRQCGALGASLIGPVQGLGLGSSDPKSR